MSVIKRSSQTATAQVELSYLPVMRELLHTVISMEFIHQAVINLYLSIFFISNLKQNGVQKL